MHGRVLYCVPGLHVMFEFSQRLFGFINTLSFSDVVTAFVIRNSNGRTKLQSVHVAFII